MMARDGGCLARRARSHFYIGIRVEFPAGLRGELSEGSFRHCITNQSAHHAAMQLILATRNRHKLGELRALLGATATCLSSSEFPSAPDVAEDALTFAGNAAKKAVALAAWLAAGANAEGRMKNEEWLVMADDSGLEVDALGGAPGVHSARFAALDSGRTGNSPDADNNAKLLRLLEGVPTERRTARFRCVLAIVPMGASAEPLFFSGACEGRIGFEARGADGFGYDALFLPAGFDLTFAELGGETKNRLSHRAQALAAFKSWLEGGGYSTRTR